MNVLYHLPILPPKMPEGEALSQEIAALRAQHDGDVVYVNPNARSRLYIPRLLFGLAQLKALHAREAEFDLHHFYNPGSYPFPYLLGLRRPVVYTISSGIGRKHIPVGYFNRLAAITVYDERSEQRLLRAGVRNVRVIPPGIDTSRFSHTPQPLEEEFRLLVASAPWTAAQFRTKGIEALLAAARQEPCLRLTFLWRGVLAEAMARRVAAMGLSERVTVINHLVDMNAVLAQVHATVALATAPGIIKAYPHSLLDSLAAGKPVLVSQAIPMADYVARTGCGQVVDKIIAEDILEAIRTLAEDYQSATTAAFHAGRNDFTLDKIITSFHQVYQSITYRK